MSGLRIDKWLWFARFCKTRGIAQRLIEDGLVERNGQLVAKTSTVIGPGDCLCLPKRPAGRRHVVVLDIGLRRGPAAEAQSLYRDAAFEEIDRFPSAVDDD